MNQRLHAKWIDLDAIQAVLEAAASGRKEGQEAALREAAATARGRSRRQHWILFASVLTALFLGFSAGLLLGATSPRAARTLEMKVTK